MGRQPAALGIRAVLVSWRDVMADIRAGHIPESRQSVQRVTRQALALLDDIEREHADDLPEDQPVTSQFLAVARSEVKGATFHDLADSGEDAG